MILIEIMTRADCCLCDEAKAVIEQVIPGFPAHIKTTDIESNPELFERYKEKIPVVLINGEESFIHKVHPITLRKKLERLLNR